MKVAIVTSDGDYVDQHFGRARYYKIYEIEDGKIVNVEMRQRGVGHHAPGQTHEHKTIDPDAPHGTDSVSQNKHAQMAMEISDCKVLIAGGMGRGAYDSFKAAGLDVILTDYSWIEEVITAYMENKIENLYEKRTH